MGCIRFRSKKSLDAGAGSRQGRLAMSSVLFTLVIREEDLRIRKRKPPCGKVFRDRKKYTRKEKHKGRCRDTAAPLVFLSLR